MGAREMRREDPVRLPGQAEGLGTTDEATSSVARSRDLSRMGSVGRGRSCLALSLPWERSTQSCAKTSLQ